MIWIMQRIADQLMLTLSAASASSASLRLRLNQNHRRDAEHAEAAQRRHFEIVRYLVVALLLVCATSISFKHAAAQSAPQELPGQVELKKGEYDNAIKLLTTRLANNSSDALAQKLLLRAYIETGRYTEAETAAKKFLLKTPEAAGVRHELAEVLVVTGRYAEAITEFEKALADLRKARTAEAEKLQTQMRLA